MRYSIVAALLLGGAVTTAHAVPISGQGTWESTLQGRDLDGNATTFEAYYDTTLDITWLADANAAGATMNWADANAWAAGLDVNGITGWRLPTVAPVIGERIFISGFSNNAKTDFGYADAEGWVNGSGVPVSEMGHMYYVTLGNLGFCTPNDLDPASCATQDGFGLTNTADFLNVQITSRYWSGTVIGNRAWGFLFFSGFQEPSLQGAPLFAWAVHSGDVGAAVGPVPTPGVPVPIPGALGLFGIGIASMWGTARRRR